MKEEEVWNPDCYSDSDEEYGEDSDNDDSEDEEGSDEESSSSENDDEDDDWSEDTQEMAKVEWSKFTKVQSLLRSVNDYMAIYSQLKESGDLVVIGSEGVSKPKHGLTDDEKEGWELLSKEQQLGVIFEKAKATIDPMEKLGESLSAEFDAEFKPGPLKGEDRVKEKRDKDYDGDIRRVIDLVRCSLGFGLKDMSKIKEIVDRLRNEESGPYSDEWKLVRVKDGFEKAENFLVGGYRDIKLNIRYKPNGHIIEVQLHLHPYLELKDNGGHKHYEFARTLKVSGVTEAVQILDPKLLKRGYISRYGETELGKLMAPGSDASSSNLRIAKAKVLRNLGDVYSGKFDYGKRALPCYDRALALLDKKPMKDRTIKVLYCQILLGYAYAINETQRHPEENPTKEKFATMDAIPLIERGLALATETLGASHPYSLRFDRILADYYDTTDRAETAIPIYESVLQRMDASLGGDHPETITCKNNFGDLLTDREEDVESVRRGYLMYLDALKGSLHRMGTEHPSTECLIGNIVIVADNVFHHFPELKSDLLQFLSNPKWEGAFASQIEEIRKDESWDRDDSGSEDDGDY